MDFDVVSMFTAIFISASVNGRLAARIILKAFRTIGSFLDLSRIFSYAWLTLYGNLSIGDSIPFFVFLKSEVFK